MSDIVCPHCGFLIPVTGKGSKTVVIIPGRARSKLQDPSETKKPSLNEILGELAAPYWALVDVFTKVKNPTPRKTAAAYVAAVKAGNTPEYIHSQARLYARLSGETRFMIQLLAWLEGEGYANPGSTMANQSPALSRISGENTSRLPRT